MFMTPLDQTIDKFNPGRAELIKLQPYSRNRHLLIVRGYLRGSRNLCMRFYHYHAPSKPVAPIVKKRNYD